MKNARLPPLKAITLIWRTRFRENQFRHYKKATREKSNLSFANANDPNWMDFLELGRLVDFFLHQQKEGSFYAPPFATPWEKECGKRRRRRRKYPLFQPVTLSGGASFLAAFPSKSERVSIPEMGLGGITRTGLAQMSLAGEIIWTCLLPIKSSMY